MAHTSNSVTQQERVSSLNLWWLEPCTHKTCLYQIGCFFLVITPAQDIYRYYRKTSNIRRTKSQNLNVSRLGLQLSSHNTLKPSVCNGEWRCSWRSADRRCSNYIWVINNFIAYSSASYIRDLTVSLISVSNQTFFACCCVYIIFPDIPSQIHSFPVIYTFNHW